MMKFQNSIRKRLVKVLGPVACRVKRSAPPGQLPPLIMTLLVRNESDIVKANIDFHLSMGVDHIFATDNCSTDGTRDILKFYETLGILTLIDEPGRHFAQSTWVNRMADMAYKRFGKCFIFHCDADEFWHCPSGNLKHELSCLPWVKCLKVQLFNVLPLHRNFNEKFPEDAVIVIEKPYTNCNVINDGHSQSFYLFEYPPKVMYRAKNSMPHVDEGNHHLINPKTYITKPSKSLKIYHFPIRGFKHFERKVMEGGSSIISNPNLSPSTGWQWRKWYQDYLEGKLCATYRDLVLDEQEANILAKQGILKINSSIRDIFFSTTKTPGAIAS